MLGALEGIKVVEVSQFAAVPAAGAVLADFGAEVIKIEHPVRGDAMRAFRNSIAVTEPGFVGNSDATNFRFEACNRNKHSVTVDITKAAGQKIVHDLVKGADVFVSNLRPNELRRYQFEYETLCQLNQRLIYANLTGYGRKGPDCETPGFDWGAYWSRTGIAYMLNGPGSVPPFGRPAFGDFPAGLTLAFGITMALLVRERTGIGQEVDVSLFATGMWAVHLDIQEALSTGGNVDQWTIDNAPNPLANMYQTKDGRWILLTHMQPDKYWPRLCKAIRRPELENDSRFNSTAARMQHNTTLIPTIQAEFAKLTAKEWLDRLVECDVIHSLIASPVEAASDPQAKAMGYIQQLQHPTRGPLPMLTPPVQLSKTPSTLREPAPELGQHTEEVLLGLGYSWEVIGKLKADGIVL